MSARTPWMAAMAREVLKGKGTISWAAMLEASVDVDALRDLCRDHGLTPKGGFRLEKAPKKVLAALLAEQEEGVVVESVVGACQRALRGAAEDSAAAGSPAPPPESAWKQKAATYKAQWQRSRELEARERASAARQRERADELAHRIEGLEADRIRLRSEAAVLRQKVDEPAPAPAPPKADSTRMRELERDLEALEVAEAGLRRRLSFVRSRERELEEQVQELEALVPKGKRRRRKPVDPPEPSKRFAVPHLQPSFYKSLESKGRRSVERAFHALLLFALEGPSYPGLEVKQLGGQDLWSLRASLKLRVYFRPREDGDIDVIALADREDQATTLRRLK